MPAPCWLVVGGADKGGILVRGDKDLTSPQLPSRLSTGAHVRELALVGERLQYERLTGSGPATGWVSVRISGKDLLVRSEAPESAASETGSSGEAAWGRILAEAEAKKASKPPAAERSQARANGLAAPPQASRRVVVKPPAEPPVRLFEVVRAACSIHEEPHMEAKVLGSRKRKMRVMCREATMNGWLKLDREPGWLLMHMHGATPGLEVVVKPVDDPPTLAVEEHQPQGMCCFEVVSTQGVDVREGPSLESPVIATRKSGEFVFAHIQSFDGWARLHGEEGWVYVFGDKVGKTSPQQKTLKIRALREVEHLDLWALSEVWAAARRARISGLSAAELQTLRKLEGLAAETAQNRFSEYKISGDANSLLRAGLITETQLQQPTAWIRQSIFAKVLENLSGQPAFKTLVQRPRPSARVPPLPHAEEEQLGVMGFWSAACLPFELDGVTWMMAPNGLMIDPSSQAPVGSWCPETDLVTPLTMVQHVNSMYLMSPDGTLMDPMSLDVVGALDAETHEVRLIDGALGEEGAVRLEEPTSREDSARGEDEEASLAAVHKHLEWAQQNSKHRCWNMAVDAYTKALEACGAAKAVDVELELVILRGRAACWRSLERRQELLADVERLRTLVCGEADPELSAWLEYARGDCSGEAAAVSGTNGRAPYKGARRTGQAAAGKAGTGRFEGAALRPCQDMLFADLDAAEPDVADGEEVLRCTEVD